MEEHELFVVFGQWVKMTYNPDNKSALRGGELCLFPNGSGYVRDWAGQIIMDFIGMGDGIVKLKALIDLGDGLRGVPTKREL